MQGQEREGRVFSFVEGGKVGALLSLFCESDFVARTETFQTLGQELCLQIIEMNPHDVEDLLKQNYMRDSEICVRDIIETAMAKTGEKITGGDFARLSA